MCGQGIKSEKLGWEKLLYYGFPHQFFIQLTKRYVPLAGQVLSGKQHAKECVRSNLCDFDIKEHDVV
jgi:hypothetical protein